MGEEIDLCMTRNEKRKRGFTSIPALPRAVLQFIEENIETEARMLASW